MHPLLCFTLFCYPFLTAADMYLNILNSTLISQGPPEVHFITDEEKFNFGLALEHVQSYWGKRDPLLPLPDRAIYKDPINCAAYQGTKYSSVRNSAGVPYKPVQTTVRFISGTVLEVKTKPEIVATKFCNNSRRDSTITCKFSLTAKRTSSVTTTWTRKLGVAAEASISVGVEGLLEFGGRLEVSAGWEGSSSNQQTTELGTEVGSETTVAPRRSVVVQLVSEVGSLRAQVEYEATVSGLVIACTGDEEFMYSTVDQILDSSGRSTSVRGTMEVVVNVYSKASLTVRDAESGEPVAFR